MSVFHVFRPIEMALYCPSAISEDKELAVLFKAVNLICWLIFIPKTDLGEGHIPIGW